MSRVVNLRMIGRFGNTLFQYAFARAYCELYDCELRHDEWIGETLFNLKSNRIQESFATRRSELDYVPAEENIEFYGYFQNQRALIYTKSQLRRWFTWRDAMKASLSKLQVDKAIAHLRRGDYFGYGYPVVSGSSYVNACSRFNIPLEDVRQVSEENPTPFDFHRAPYVADFYRMTRAEVLLRANSSFSWWAAALAPETQRVLSPVIDGLEGGREHDCEFVEGNHPRLSNHTFVTDLVLAP